MSTRSFIGIRNEDGSITGIYCHWDGYPEYVGRILRENYRNEKIVRELISYGDISSLGELIHPPADENHTYENPCSGVTVFYHRDRGEEWSVVEPKTFPDFIEAVKNSWFDYIYVWERVDGGCWYVGDVHYITHYDMFNGFTVTNDNFDPVIKTVTEYEPLTEEICKTNRMPSNTMQRAVEIAESYCRQSHSIYSNATKVGMMRVFLDALEVYKENEE